MFSQSDPKDLTDQVEWSSSATDVVEIGLDGAATAQPKSGAATIKAAKAGKLEQFNVRY